MARSIELRGFTFVEIGGLVYVKGDGISNPAGVVLGPADSLNLGRFQGFERVPGVSAAAAAALASFTNLDVGEIKSALDFTQPKNPDPASQATPTAAPEPPREDPAANRTPPASEPVNTDPVGGAAPPPPAQVRSGDNKANDDNPQAAGASVNAEGQNVGLLIQDQNGAVSNQRINPETGQAYDPGDLPVSNSVQPSVTGVFNPGTRPQIFPEPNVLDQFSSYTYRLSVYLMSPSQYEQLIKSTKKTVNGYNLLFQSGGAPINSTGFQGALGANFAAAQADLEAEGIGFRPSVNTPGAGQPDAGRNPAFPLDFYIDSCTLTNQMQGAATGAAHSVDTLKFTVIEPVGITLLDRMYEAVQDAAPRQADGAVNYQNAQYLMVIRWYGFDANGNVVGGSANNSDPRAAVEKFIAFTIRNVHWRVSSKATEYEFECAPIGQLVATGTRRGVVPFDIQLSQSTVGTILAGQLTYVDRPTAANAPGASTTPTTGDFARADRGQPTVTAPPKANAAGTPKLAVKQGLMAAMNEFTKKLVQEGKYQIADEYEIVFAPGAEAIRDAAIVLPNVKPEARQGAMTPPASVNPQSLDPSKQSKDKSVASKYIFAGQSIVQIIDQVIRNSTYVTNQALLRYDGDQQESNSDVLKKSKPVDWYRINFEAVPIGNRQDSRRNDWAYKIRYIITAYKIDNYDSKYFPLGSFRGVHKTYPYWFTGKNTAVLDYSEVLNNAYNMLVSGSDPTNSASEEERRKVASTMRELITYTYGPASNETRQGSRGKGNEIGANIADSLYGGQDLALTKLQIIGDPAWIQQGSLVGGIKEDLFNPSSFLPDGTINFDAEQVNFDVSWGRPADYNIQTGLANPGSAGQPISRVYTARQVTSEFRQGTFTQTIDGMLFNMPRPDGTNKAIGASMPAKTSDGRTEPGQQDPANTTNNSRVYGTGPQNTAAAGAANTALTSEPPKSLPTKAQTLGSAPGRSQAPRDNLRSTPPPTPPTSGSGQTLPPGTTTQPPPRLPTRAEILGSAPGRGTGAGQRNVSQTQTWEP